MRIRLLVALAVTLPAAAVHGQTASWSTPTRTEQVDPEWMKNPRPVTGGGALEAGLAGTWDLWVSGGFWYSSDGLRVYRNYTPGAAMNRLSISRDGRYRWHQHRGRIAEIQPWFAQPGERYYAVQMDGATRYMARYDAAKDEVNLFFWGVGGHAAKGTRIGPRPARAPAPPRPAAQP